MPDRRTFIRGMSTAAAGMLIAGAARQMGAQTRPAGGRRQITIGGRRVKTIDIHTHVYVRDVIPLLRNVDIGGTVKSAASGTRGNRLTPDFLDAESVRWMDDHGIDVQARSINPYWYSLTDRALATKLIAVQNAALARDCAKFPGRFVGLATCALQFPDLAAQQLEEAVKKHGMPGVAIACNINGEELGSERFDPFYKMCVDLGAAIFIHPQGEGGFDGRAYPKGFADRLRGMGNLGNVIGYPTETSIAFGSLIYSGTLDRFPGLRVVGAHGGGFIFSYSGRLDANCEFSEGARKRCAALKKKPSDYMREQLISDSLVFNPEELVLRVRQYGVSQVVLGTDHPAPWPTTGVDHVLETPGLTDDEKFAILGGNLSKLLRIPQFEATT